MRNAFSLVELSIVLVILGLLTGGILAGQSLIRAAELRSVTTEYQKWVTATRTFQDKYFAIPGDMTNAEAFWGTMTTGTCPNATAGTGTQTCNGNGDGIINGGVASQTAEMFTYWQHLTNAGLIEGSFTGISGADNSNDVELPINAPASKLSNSGWSMYSWGNNVAASNSFFDGNYNNVFVFGAEGVSLTETASLLGEEAWNIDKKLDDGLPGAGRLVTRTRAGCTNATSAPADSDNFDAEYGLSSSTPWCALIFKNNF